MERKKYRLVCNRIVEYMLQASSCGSNGLTMLTFLEKRPKKLKNILKDEREKIMSWECPECAFLNNASASKCICGYEPNTTVTAASLPTESLQTNSSIDSEKAQSSEISQVQPWLRFGARVIDYNLNALNLFFIIGFFIGFAAPHSIESFNLMLGNFFYSILFGMAFMFIRFGLYNI